MASKEDFVQGLRDAADFIEQHPEVVGSYGDDYFSLDIASFGVSKDQLASAARAGGGWEKNYTQSYFELCKRFGGGVKISLNADRDQVCTKRVVGTVHVEAELIPAHDREIVEWDCVPLLVDTAGGDV